MEDHTTETLAQPDTMSANTKSNIRQRLRGILVAALAITFIILVGIIGYMVFNKPAIKNIPESYLTHSSSAEQPVADTSVKFGETLQFNELTVGLSALEYTPHFDEFLKADEGTTYAIVSVTIKNNTSQTIQFPDNLFKAATVNGAQMASQQVYGEVYKQLPETVAPNGGESAGFIAFQVSNADKVQTIQFEYKPVDAMGKDVMATYAGEFTL